MKSNSAPSTSKQRTLKIISTISAIIVVVVLIIFRDIVGEFRQWGYLGIFLVSLVGNATVLVPLPVIATIGAMGISLNPFFVGLCASTGAVLGESIGYFLGLAGNIIVEKSDKYNQAKGYIEKYGAWAIFLLACIPNPLFDLAGIMAGAMGISYRKFFVSVWVGTFLKYTLVSLVGFGLFG